MQKLSDYLTEERIVFLEADTKEEAVREMIRTVGRTAPELEEDEAVRAVLERENAVSSWLAPGIAIPHARLAGLKDFILALGVSTAGLKNESGDRSPVHLLLMILGRREEPDRHIHLLAQIARMVKQSQLKDAILRARSAGEILSRIAGSETAAAVRGREIESTRLLLRHAAELAEETGARAILVHADAAQELLWIGSSLAEDLRDKLILITSGETSSAGETEGPCRCIRVPFPGLNRQNQIEIAVIFALSRGMLSRTDAVVVATGPPRSGMLDTLSVIRIERELPSLLPAQDMSLLSDLDPLVLEKVLQLAAELAAEGREGKPAGAAFVVGDYDHVAPYCHQLVINPFRGYRDDEKNILDPNLDETIKEFSLLDGAFILRRDGVIMSAGTFIRADDTVPDLPSGLGARHAAAASISLCTRAASIVVSQSTGAISVFSGGKAILSLEKRNTGGGRGNG